jgi:predicted DNA-binding mobile mystery protein A
LSCIPQSNVFVFTDTDESYILIGYIHAPHEKKMLKTNSMTSLAGQQMERRFSILREQAGLLSTPKRGWIRLLRTSLGMRQHDFGARLGITAQAAGQLEQREMNEAVTLKSLRQAADALGADLHYVFVPRQPLSATVEDRISRAARYLAGQIDHTMRLENQAPGEAASQARLRQIEEQLRLTPSLLWTLPDDL